MSTALNHPKPIGYERDLGEYGPQFYDSNGGKPIKWGFRILYRLGEERFQALKGYGALEYAPGRYPFVWYLITKQLTYQDAIEEYGAVTAEERDPRGGWRSDTFGSTRFLAKLPHE